METACSKILGVETQSADHWINVGKRLRTYASGPRADKKVKKKLDSIVGDLDWEKMV